MDQYDETHLENLYSRHSIHTCGAADYVNKIYINSDITSGQKSVQINIQVFSVFDIVCTRETQAGKMRALLNSTNIHEAIYQPASQTLKYIFISRNISYCYAGVPSRVFQELIEAPSAGRYYNRKIKGQFTSLRYN